MLTPSEVLVSFSSGMSKEEVVEWFRRLNGRHPDAYEVYEVAKVLYNGGAFGKAATALEAYANLQGGGRPEGTHLLGYAYYNSGRHQEALSQFLVAVQSGFEQDWQLLIELQIEMEMKSTLAE